MGGLCFMVAGAWCTTCVYPALIASAPIANRGPCHSSCDKLQAAHHSVTAMRVRLDRSRYSGGSMNRNQKSDRATSSRRTTVVGIGASAGGIEALREFFDAVPSNLGLAYVVIVHLAPDHNSELAAIIGRRTKMPVVEVSATKLELKPDHVYVISPDHKLEISDTSIGATSFDEPRGRRAAIDVFFRSLAESHGDSFAIVLSGGGSDGAVGAKAAKRPAASCWCRIRARRHTRGCREPSLRPRLPIWCYLCARSLHGSASWRDTRKSSPLSCLPLQAMPTSGRTDELVLKRIFDLVRLRTDHDFSRYSAANIGTDKAGADKGAALCFSKRGHSLGELGSFWRTYGPELVAHQAIPFDG